MNDMNLPAAAEHEDTFSTLGEIIPTLFADSGEPELEAKPRNPRMTDYDCVKGHLASGESITHEIAFELYGMSVGSLYCVISKLRREDGWLIKRGFIRDKSGNKASEYTYVGMAAECQDETTQEDTRDEPAAPEQPKPAVAAAPITVSTARIANIRMGTDGPELLLVGDGESDTRPFYRLTAAQVKYLSLNLALFAEMAE